MKIYLKEKKLYSANVFILTWDWFVNLHTTARREHIKHAFDIK